MKRFKKVLALVLAGVLALAMLTACDGGTTDSDKHHAGRWHGRSGDDRSITRLPIRAWARLSTVQSTAQ